jgi:hypothetical protein
MSEQHRPAPREARASSGPDGEPSRLHSRRGLVFGAVATGAGAAAALVAGAGPADAANNNPVELGVSNSATAATIVSTTVGNGLEGVTSQAGLSGVAGVDSSTAAGGGHGVYGRSGVGIGVYGTINGATTGQSAVYGNDASNGGYGVYGT